ncbi:Coenzyme F420 hydrogenase/dehydrogenase, beta subunit C-terminal domain [Methanopyrus sp.]
MAEFEWRLTDEVVEPGACTHCGTCVAVCPGGILELTDEGPRLTEECARKGTGNCHAVCPRVDTAAYHLGLRIAGRDYDPLTGGYRRAVGAVASDPDLRELGQDGGAVTAIAKYVLEEGIVDAVVGVTAGSAWKPCVTIVEEPEKVEELAGSKYTRVGLVQALAEAADRGVERVLAVGLPCQVNGLTKLSHFEIVAKGARVLRNIDGTPAEKLPEIVATIGLFCTKNFEYDTLVGILKKKGVDIEDVELFDITAGKFRIELSDGETREYDVKDFEDAVPEGCRVCHDFTARLADISAGSVGTPEGVTTLLIRSEIGEELVEGAVESGYLRLRDGVDVSEVRRLARLKYDWAMKEAKNRLDKGQKVPSFWTGDYGGTISRADGTFAVRIKVGPGGWVNNPDVFRAISGLLERGYRAKFTDRQQLEIHGIPATEVPEVIERLREVGLSTGSEGPLVRSIMACPGEGNCSSGVLSTEELAKKLEEELAEEPTPYKFKIALSGCTNSCVRPQHHDIGFAGAVRPAVDPEKCTGCGQCADVCKVDAIRIVTVGGQAAVADTDYKRCVYCGKCIEVCPEEARYAEKEGVIIWLGGKGGRQPVEGARLDVFADPGSIPAIVRAVIEKYRELAEEPQKERLADTIRKHGLRPFTEAIRRTLSR